MKDFSKPVTVLKYGLVFLFLCVLSFVFHPSAETWGINKTIGWAFDICSLNISLLLINLTALIVVYGLLSAFRSRVNSIVSATNIIFLLAISILLIVNFKSQYCSYVFYMSIITILFPLINIAFAIYYKVSGQLQTP